MDYSIFQNTYKYRIYIIFTALIMNHRMKKVLFIFGTRPEAIKLAPLIKTFLGSKDFVSKVCITAQHREMLDQVLSFFDIEPDYDLNLMAANQSLNQLAGKIFNSLHNVLLDFKPDYVFVQGDTTSAFVGGVAGFYAGSKVCHIEAGLRTFDKYAPFPEEVNRAALSQVAAFHFAPTEQAKSNLLHENIAEENILVSGNTVIDALLMSSSMVNDFRNNEIELVEKLLNGKPIILVTGHRRENFGDGFIHICKAIKRIASNNDVQVIYPVHLNPNVQEPVFSLLGELKNVHLIKPLSYPAFIWLMKKSHLILTDSGGIQEEAPSLQKPVLVMRDTTERPESIDAGTVLLVGTDEEKIVRETELLLNDTTRYNKMANSINPFGDGTASEKILNFLRDQN